MKVGARVYRKDRPEKLYTVIECVVTTRLSKRTGQVFTTAQYRAEDDSKAHHGIVFKSGNIGHSIFEFEEGGKQLSIFDCMEENKNE